MTSTHAGQQRRDHGFSASPEPGANRLLRAHAETPRWELLALLSLLGATAVLYLWGLGASGWANAYYSAAAQAGSQSWKALFFASSDAANSITVDKPPVSLWVMGLSARIFGVNAWSILVPQALMGVAAVGVLYASVRRTFGPVAGLIAGLVLATTPVATLMFRFNNPDALLVLLLVAAAYATLRAQEKASTRWLVAAGTLIGFAFLAKMLQALLVVPAFGLVYLLTAPTTLWHRVRQLGAGLAALVISAGWYIALVELIPASARPYIGGSQNNSILELTLGYNGLGRITGDEVGSVGGRPGPGPGGGWGETGWLRLFDSENGGQVAWLLPAALLLLAAGLWATRRAPRIDRSRAAFAVWGGWLLVTGLVFSHMQGIFHAYYDVALAPAVGALVGAGSVALWRARETAPSADASSSFAARPSTVEPSTVAPLPIAPLPIAPLPAAPLPTAPPIQPAPAQGAATTKAKTLGAVARALSSVVLAAAIAGTAIWSYLLLDRTPAWHPWLRTTIVAVGIAAGALLLVAERLPRRVVIAAATAGLIAALLGPVAYSVATAATPHAGGIPSAGPVGAISFAGPGGPGALGSPGAGGFPAGPAMLPPDGFPGGPAGDGTNAAGRTPPTGPIRLPNGTAAGIGGLLNASETSDELVALLTADVDAYTWVAATIGANSAAGVQLSTGEPVMPIGGFNGSDPSPTLEQFQTYVAEGRIHYFLGGGMGAAGTGPGPMGPGSALRGGTGGPAGPGGAPGGQHGGSDTARQISAWVTANFTATTVGGVTVYDLTAPSTTTAPN